MFPLLNIHCRSNKIILSIQTFLWGTASTHTGHSVVAVIVGLHEKITSKSVEFPQAHRKHSTKKFNEKFTKEKKMEKSVQRRPDRRCVTESGGSPDTSGSQRVFVRTNIHTHTRARVNGEQSARQSNYEFYLFFFFGFSSKMCKKSHTRTLFSTSSPTYIRTHTCCHYTLFSLFAFVFNFTIFALISLLFSLYVCRAHSEQRTVSLKIHLKNSLRFHRAAVNIRGQ